MVGQVGNAKRQASRYGTLDWRKCRKRETDSCSPHSSDSVRDKISSVLRAVLEGYGLMRIRFGFIWTSVLLLAPHAALSQTSNGTSAPIPHLAEQGTATQLIVDGEPFLVLGGELHNSSASDLNYLRPIWPRLKAMHINTVLTPVYWEFLEPREGEFDFSLVDGQIREAERHDMRIVFLWFGSWKNAMSSYVPEWVKTNQDRFPRIEDKDGNGIEALSTFSVANRDADAKAFAVLMRHIKEVDVSRRVVMVQVENETGRFTDTRDRSKVANEAYEGPVPPELLDYIGSHKDTLHPQLRGMWEASGSKTSGSWPEVFGESIHTEEAFAAWFYAIYVNHVAAAGKAEYPLPMFVNAFPSGRGRTPGMYPSGGPAPEVADVWKAGGPSIDILTPNSYSPDVITLWGRYHTANNPLFVPETQGDSGAFNVFYAIGKHDAIGFAPFAIDSLGLGSNVEAPTEPADLPLAQSYETLAQVAPLISEHQGMGTMSGALVSPGEEPQEIPLGDYVLVVSYPRRRGPPMPPTAQPSAGGASSGAPQSSPAGGPPRGPRLEGRVGGLFIAVGPDEYIVAGSGPLSVEFRPNTPGDPIAGFLSIEEGTFVNGRWLPGRRLNGDESGQGRGLRLGGDSSRNGPIQRVKLYRYR